MRPADVRRAVFAWARTRERPLPWRGERDPYRVLVSEVMLQQTQASRVAEIYPRFLRRFPTVEALAHADGADVLRAWENLGYNRRALDLWRCARAVVARGAFPSSVSELEALPGLGPYTARAVASFAFGADVSAVDANVRRVVTRLFAVDRDVQTLADGLVPRGRAAEWNQAMIDVGAEVCRARNPRCGECPLRRWCSWQPAVQPVRAATERFEDTSRYARGRVVEALRSSGSLARSALSRRVGLPDDRLTHALRSLERDAIVHVDGRRVVLGPRG